MLKFVLRELVSPSESEYDAFALKVGAKTDLFYSVNDTIDGYDTDRDSFIGLYNGFGDPQAVIAGKATNSFADGWAPIASHYKKITLAPGETKTLVFVLGYVEMPVAEKFEADGKTINKVKALEMIEKAKANAAAKYERLGKMTELYK